MALEVAHPQSRPGQGGGGGGGGGGGSGISILVMGKIKTIDFTKPSKKLV